MAGARVIGTGSTRNRDFVLGLGADEYVDYTQEEVGEVVSGADLAFDTVGGETTASTQYAVVRAALRELHRRQRVANSSSRQLGFT